MEKVLIIDGMNFIHRANISFGKSNDSSEYVLIYNFFRNLRASVEQISPSKLFFVLEGHPKFRYDIYPEYKANRRVKTAEKQSAKDKIHSDSDIILQLINNLPVTICKALNYEADDVVSTLCENLKDEQVIVLSNDSDYIQVLQRGYSNCSVFFPMKKEFMQPPTYKYTVWKSINGDKTDNIKALLTPKKAMDVVMDLDKMKSYLSIDGNNEKYLINKKLVEFADVPLEDINMISGSHNYDVLKDKFKEMEFVTLTEDNYWNKFVSTFRKIGL